MNWRQKRREAREMHERWEMGLVQVVELDANTYANLAEVAAREDRTVAQQIAHLLRGWSAGVDELAGAMERFQAPGFTTESPAPTQPEPQPRYLNWREHADADESDQEASGSLADFFEAPIRPPTFPPASEASEEETE